MMNWRYTNISFVWAWASLYLILAACSGKENKRFELLPPSQTGIHFQNQLEDTPALNILSYLYFYNGGGIAAGDLTGNGLPDLYFTSNLDSNKLYINHGNFQFTDVTLAAGVFGQKGWTTGVTMADVNGDGKLDIYVSQVGDFQHIRGKNQLFINLGNDENGIPVFEDQAEEFGLDLVGFSTQAVFFDYDLDGDLDMFMLNHSVHSNGTYGKSDLRMEVHPLAGDRLFRNDNGKFTDVTKEAGIYSSALGYGLGVTVSDVNRDGYPDIYVGNDFHENDYLYINNGDGTFTESIESSMMHTSRYSMGNDIADINNDGLPDIISLDMQPSDPAKLKTSAGEDPYDIYNFKLDYGYNHQFSRNTLQLNNGNGTFSEIAALAGLYATDWSWSGLITDLDLDGNKDIFITNGIKRRMNDLDFINFISNDAIQHRLEGNLTEEDISLIEKIPVVKIPNHIFQNNGNLTFTDVSDSWGLSHESFSNGAVYVDLDNDGDLDLVINNIDQDAFIYKNNTIDGEKQDNNYLKISLEGEGANTKGIGAKIIIPLAEGKIIQEMFNTRGFQSSISNELVIGLGQMEIVDSLTVIWPDRKFEVLRSVKVNQHLKLKQANAAGQWDFSPLTLDPVFISVTDSIGLDYKHEENDYNEFNREPLMPHMVSTEGPKLAVGDVNGDGLEDFFVGGAKRQQGRIYIQTVNGLEQLPQEAFRIDSLSEDIGAAFLDVDNDGDLDLVVISGGNEFDKKSQPTRVRLYKNNGKGIFTKDDNALPEIYMTGSCVKAADFNNDGHMDLFLGGRVVPWNYGLPAESYLLQNDGNGKLVDVTDKIAPFLKDIGMVRDATWADIDNDGNPDLILAGEWMPVTILLNRGERFEKMEVSGISELKGWWNTVKAVDMNNDGHLDLIAGNLGLNSKLQASNDKPLSLYVGDFDDNGQKEQLLTYYLGGSEQLFATKDEIVKQLPSLKSRFLKYEDFAKAGMLDIVPQGSLNNALKLTIHELRSGIFINKGNMQFEFQPFPIQAQFSPINSIHVMDYDNDGHPDILSGGNFYEVNTQLGRYDADFGSLMRNKGNGELEYIPDYRSGLKLKGQVRDIQSLMIGNKTLLLVTINNDSIRFLETKDRLLR